MRYATVNMPLLPMLLTNLKQKDYVIMIQIVRGFGSLNAMKRHTISVHQQIRYLVHIASSIKVRMLSIGIR